jgi:hypothetical protein
MTTTVTTTVTTVTALGLGAALGALLTGALIVLLVARELAGASDDERARAWRRAALAAVVPLFVSFAVIAAVKISAL